MPIPGIPHCVTAQLWDAICSLVRGSNVANVVGLLQLYEGRTTELDAWSKDTLPAVRFTPAGNMARWSAEMQHDAPLVVNVELVTASTYAGDLFDLWAAVVAVFFPGDNTVLNSLRPLGVYLISIASPAWSSKTLDDGTRVLYGTGALQFSTHLNT